MELRVLRYFLAVAREESISGAAEALHVTQPTLSRQMMELEEELGKTLFLRGKRKISLTEEGMFLRKRAQEIVTLVEKTESEFSAAEETISGDVHIGGGETDAMRLIARAAHRLQSAYPHIAYHLFSGNADDVTERLDRGLVDFGVFIESADLSKYDFIKLPVTDIWGVLMRKDCPLAARATIRPQDLLGLPLLASNQHLVKNEFSGWFGEGYEKLNIITTYNLLYNASIMWRKAWDTPCVWTRSSGHPAAARCASGRWSRSWKWGCISLGKSTSFSRRPLKNFWNACNARSRIGGRRIAQRTNRATGKRTQKGKRGFSGKAPLPLWSILLLPTDYIRSGVRLQWRSR